MAEILVADQADRRDQRAPMNSEPAVLWVVVAATGLTMMIVGWTDLLLLWYPLHVGDPQWEFATLSAHFAGMPLGTLGLGLLAVGAIGRGWRRAAQILAVFSFVVALFSLLVIAMFLLDLPVLIKGTPPQMARLMKVAVVKTGVFSVSYVVFYAWLGWYLLRVARLSKG